MTGILRALRLLRLRKIESQTRKDSRSRLATLSLSPCSSSSTRTTATTTATILSSLTTLKLELSSARLVSSHLISPPISSPWPISFRSVVLSIPSILQPVPGLGFFVHLLVDSAPRPPYLLRNRFPTFFTASGPDFLRSCVNPTCIILHARASLSSFYRRSIIRHCSSGGSIRPRPNTFDLHHPRRSF